MKIMNTKTTLLAAGISVMLLFNGGSCDRTKKDGDSSLEAFLRDTPNNVSPIANAGIDVTILRGNTVTLNGSESYDTDGQIVLYQWYLGDELISEGSTPTADTSSFPAGTYSLVLVVTDDDDATGADIVLVTVKKPEPPVVVNQPPVANAGPDQEIIFPHGNDQTVNIASVESIAIEVPTIQIVQLDGSRSTDDGKVQPLSYSWSAVNNNAMNSSGLSDPTSVNPTFDVQCFDECDYVRRDTEGDTLREVQMYGPVCEYEWALTVNDGEFEDNDTVVISVDYRGCNLNEI